MQPVADVGCVCQGVRETVAARRVKTDAERQADSARLQLRLQQNQADAERKVMERQEHSKWKVHTHRMDILRRKEQARGAVLHMTEAEFSNGLTHGHSTDAEKEDTMARTRAKTYAMNAVRARQADVGEEEEAAEQRRATGDLQSTLSATVDLEERSDGSFRLLIIPAELSSSNQQSLGAEGSGSRILSCLRA